MNYLERLKMAKLPSQGTDKTDISPFVSNVSSQVSHFQKIDDGKTDNQATALTAKSTEHPPLGSFGSTQTVQISKTDTDSNPRYWRFQVTDATGKTSISHVTWLTLEEMQRLCPNATVTPLDDPKPQATGMTANDEKSIRQWLSLIGEINSENITDVLHQCQTDIAASQYFLQRAQEIKTGRKHYG